MNKKVTKQVNESKANDTVVRIQRWWATEHSTKEHEVIMVELEDSRLGLFHVNFDKAITEEDCQYKLDIFKGETNSGDSVQLHCPVSQIVMPLSLRKRIFRGTLQSILENVTSDIDGRYYHDCLVLRTYINSVLLLPDNMCEEEFSAFADDIELISKEEGLYTDDKGELTEIPKRLRKMVDVYRKLWPDDKFEKELSQSGC
ncbi:MAG: hypothetical protein WCP12_14655 [bacterium]